MLVQSEYIAEEVPSMNRCSWACGLYTKAVKPYIGGVCLATRRSTAIVVVVSDRRDRGSFQIGSSITYVCIAAQSRLSCLLEGASVFFRERGEQWTPVWRRHCLLARALRSSSFKSSWQWARFRVLIHRFYRWQLTYITSSSLPSSPNNNRFVVAGESLAVVSVESCNIL